MEGWLVGGPALPAGGVPVATHVGSFLGHHHHMAHAYPDLVAAPRAEVLLMGLIGLDPEHVERAKAFRGAGHGSGRLGEEGPGK